jgi:hypothetical protein
MYCTSWYSEDEEQDEDGGWYLLELGLDLASGGLDQAGEGLDQAGGGLDQAAEDPSMANGDLNQECPSVLTCRLFRKSFLLLLQLYVDKLLQLFHVSSNTSEGH